MAELLLAQELPKSPASRLRYNPKKRIYAERTGSIATSIYYQPGLQPNEGFQYYVQIKFCRKH